jgi:hypothetical protein
MAFRCRSFSSRTSFARALPFLTALLWLLIPLPAKAGVDPQPFHGWLVTPLGGAVLGDTVLPDTLEVNNLGSSGQDGVRFDAGTTRGRLGPVRWMAPESLSGRQYRVVSEGSDAAGTLWWATDAVNRGGVIEFSIDPGNLLVASSTVILTLTNDGTAVYTAELNNSMSPLFSSSAPPVGVSEGLGEIAADFTPSGAGKAIVPPRLDDRNFEFETGTQIVLEGVGSFSADGVRISHRLRHRDRLVLHHLDLLLTEPTGSTGSLRLRDVAMQPYFGTTRGRGGVLLQSSAVGSQGRLTVSNIGSSGEDGVACDFEEDELGVGLQWDPSSLPPPSDTASIMLSADAGQGTAPDDPIVSCSSRYGNGAFAILCDAATSGPPQKVAFYLDELIVGVASDPTAALQVSTTEWPSSAGVEHGDVPGQPIVSWGWDQPVSMQVGTEASVLADEVRLVLPSLVATTQWTNRLILTPPGNASPYELTVLGRRNTIHPPDPIIPYAALRGLHEANIVHRDLAARVSNIGSSGEDGVTVEFEPASILGIQWHSSWTGAGSPGERIMMPTYGTSSGDPDQPIIVGRLWSESTGSEVQVGGDLSPLGVAGLIFNLYDDGVLVNSITAVNDAPALSMPAPPTGMSARAGANGPVFILQLPANTQVSLPSAPTKSTSQADFVVALPSETPVVVPTELVALSLRVVSIPWVVIDDTSPSYAVDAPPSRAAATLTLYPNVPNPFNPRTSIAFDLDRSGPVSLRVYDVRGRLVDVLQDGYLRAGHYQKIWEGSDERGHRVASGIYYLRLDAEGGSRTSKMSLVR